MRARALIYFSLLGLGFLFVEMPLAQRFILFLGHPITALAVVLFAILLFSGLGSLTAPRWRLPAALGVLVALIAVYPLALPAVFDAALGLPLAARMAVALLLLAPLGVMMGVPFARGLALVEALAPGLTPWVWAINGCASVVSAILAVMAAISWGLSAVLWLGAACYLGALVAMARLPSRAGDAAPSA
ncbi:MAG: phosphoethanolamine transferase CptA [Anaerolineae bacterium]|nr:phosphoethanolamine transferase CptA [Anaerolineae bacterium]